MQLIPKDETALWWVGLPVHSSVTDGKLAHLDSTKIADGAYILRLTVRDKAGTETTSEVANITIANNHRPNGIVLR